MVDELPYEKRFHFGDGTAVKDLRELKERVESVPYDEFYRHVNGEKNDFANWVEHVLSDKELAHRLRDVQSIVETVELLNEAIHPEETLAAETRLGHDDDYQLRIEEQLFADLEAPGGKAKEEVPEMAGTPDSIVTVSMGDAGDDEPRLPSREELDFKGRLPGAPVTTAKRPHVRVTERVGRPVSHEEHLRFLTKESVYGFLLGIVTGLILGGIMGQIFG